MSEVDETFDSLKDFAERAPANYVSVFTLVSGENLANIVREGLKTEYRFKKTSDSTKKLDRLIEEEAKRVHKNGFKRSFCIYAYPFNPNISPPSEYYPGEHGVVLEVKVPKNSWVANQVDYEYAAISLNESGQRSFIQSYVDKATKLESYNGNFDKPEVLITNTVPTKYIRLASKS